MLGMNGRVLSPDCRHLFKQGSDAVCTSTISLSTRQIRREAIGRARRHGQPRDVVHVWRATSDVQGGSVLPCSACLGSRRFVTADTVEQAITEEHQAGRENRSLAGQKRFRSLAQGALWKCEQERQRQRQAQAQEPGPEAEG